ncbi:hypothetical protein IV203_005673 [Nitzschia inconspicua]|uniref:Uncharacterized protein n=1 Tax=Nitzschia inconspicua TaxID=303405 RepID=A0A9K3PIY0_9STRA|nr:hypothetical protein IV203_005673 [Nitzschia inconspicua]
MTHFRMPRRAIFLVILVASSRAQDNNETTSVSIQDEDPTMDCPLCNDPSHTPQDPFSIFVAGDATLSCQTAFEMGPIRLPAQNCRFWQQRGSTICQCASEAPAVNTCTLCDNGQSLPNPLLEGRPGLTCAELQIQARRDDPDNCVIWQQTQGIYCGCDNAVSESTFCRLCGNGNPDLFFPLEMVTSVGRASSEEMMSCGEVEFQANLPNNVGRCSEYRTFFGEQCCRELLQPTMAPSEFPTLGDLDNAARSGCYGRLFILTVVAFTAIFHSLL